MLIPKFTIGKQKLLIGKKFISNGHWMVTREACSAPLAPKALKPLLSVMHGTYQNGIADGLSGGTLPDFAQVIPKRDGYIAITDPSGVEFRGDTVQAYVFDSPDFKIGINPDYMPIVRMGHAFAKDKTSPILVLDGTTLNDNLVAVVMPLRLGNV